MMEAVVKNVSKPWTKLPNFEIFAGPYARILKILPDKIDEYLTQIYIIIQHQSDDSLTLLIKMVITNARLS